jgi:hypothetical protein
MSELQLLSDEDLTVRLHETMLRHDRLIDSAPMGDERIYFANKECEAIKAEQQRRGYKPCHMCFDFGEVTDMHGDVYGFCKCRMGVRLQDETARRNSRRASQSTNGERQ